MSLVATAVLTFNDTVEKYMASVLHFDEVKAENKSSFLYNIDSDIQINDYFYSAENQNPNLINLTITHDPTQAFATSGSSDNEIMKLVVTTYEEPFVLKSLRFKIVGVEANKIKEIKLFDGETELASATILKGYATIKDLNFAVGKNTVQEISVKVDFSEELSSGDRLRLDIEAPEDLVILVGGENYHVNEYYPIKGEYLSITQKRPWGLTKEEK